MVSCTGIGPGGGGDHGARPHFFLLSFLFSLFSFLDHIPHFCSLFVERKNLGEKNLESNNFKKKKKKT